MKDEIKPRSHIEISVPALKSPQNVAILKALRAEFSDDDIQAVEKPNSHYEPSVRIDPAFKITDGHGGPDCLGPAIFTAIQTTVHKVLATFGETHQ